MRIHSPRIANAAIYLSTIASLILLVNGCRETSNSFTPDVATKKVNVSLPKRVEQTVETAIYFGFLESNRSRTFGFKTNGTLSSIAKRGQIVQANQMLAELDTTDLEQQRKSLEEDLVQFQNQPQGQAIREQIAALQQQIQSSQIVAPFDCVVAETFAFEESLVRPQSPILRVLDSTSPRVKIDLPRRVSRLIRPDQEVFFVIDGDAIIGKLVEKSITEHAGNITTWFEITSDITNLELKFGQTIEARFNFPVDNSGYWLPLTAIARSGEGVWSVLVVNESNGESIVKRKLVTIEQFNDHSALVKSRFGPGDLVIVDGIHRVVSGQVVETNLVQEKVTSFESPQGVAE